jgi:hypothetical protein
MIDSGSLVADAVAIEGAVFLVALQCELDSDLARLTDLDFESLFGRDRFVPTGECGLS